MGSSGDSVMVCTADRGAFCEVFITAALANTDDTAPSAIFDAVGQILAELGVQPLTDKVYGRLADIAALTAARRSGYKAHGLDADTLPFVLIEGAPTNTSPLSGVQVWGVAAASPEHASPNVRTVSNEGTRGRLWDAEGARILWLGGLDGSDADGVLEPGDETRRLLAKAPRALAAHDLHFGQVARTWFYLPRILEWYDEFNRVRTEAYSTFPLPRDAEGHITPASTGIQASVWRTDGEPSACTLDLLAVDGEGVGVHQVRRSRRQDQANDYGSLFSRAVVLDWSAGKTIFVSGTAAIDGDGASVYRDDAEAQSMATLMAVGALLEEQGATLADIATSVLFCKTRAAADAWTRVTSHMGVPNFPVIPVIGDVCRPELLLELEATALVPK